jgi:hypothetical protein
VRGRVHACSFDYPVCNAHASYCDICGPSGSTTLLDIISQTAQFSEKKKLLSTKCVFQFSLQLLSTTFLILRIVYRDTVMNVKSLHVKYPLYLSDFNET